MPLQWKICLCGLPPRARSPPYLQVWLHRRFQEARAKYFLSFIMTISVKVLEAAEKEGQNSTAVGSLESSFKEQSHSSCSCVGKMMKVRNSEYSIPIKSKTKRCNNAHFSGYFSYLLLGIRRKSSNKNSTGSAITIWKWWARGKAFLIQLPHHPLLCSGPTLHDLERKLLLLKHSVHLWKLRGFIHRQILTVRD